VNVKPNGIIRSKFEEKKSPKKTNKNGVMILILENEISLT
jgi:hypothetical protein